MADLLATAEGRGILQKIACYLGRRRMSRKLKRAFMLAYEGYQNTGNFDFSVLLNNMNPSDQDEVLALGQMLGAQGCFDLATTQDMTIYIDGTNGSDVSGSGSLTNPYQTLAFLSQFPKFINHAVRILFLSDVTHPEPVLLDQKLGPNGSLIIGGIGNAEIVTTSNGAGPFALTAGCVYYGPPYTAFQFNTVENWGINELYGKWIKFVDGVLANQTIPVHDNDLNDIWTRGGWDFDAVGPVFPSPGDQFVFVQPPVELTLPAIKFAISGTDPIRDNPREGSRFGAFNLTFNTRDTTYRYNKFVISNSCESIFSFCTSRRTGNTNGNSRISSAINNYRHLDTAAIALLNSDVANLNVSYSLNQTPKTCSGLLFWTDSWPPISQGVEEVILDTESFPANFKIVRAIDTAAECKIVSGGIIQASGIAYSAIYERASLDLSYSMLAGKTTGSTVLVAEAGLVRLQDNTFRRGVDCVGVEFGDLILQSNKLGPAASYSGVGLHVYAMNRTRLVNAPVITGTLGDIDFTTVGIVAWPGAPGTTQTNALGSFVTRI